MNETSEYDSFLLRIFRFCFPEYDSDQVAWRCEIEHIQSGHSWQFDDLQELADFLSARCIRAGGPGEEAEIQDAAGIKRDQFQSEASDED